MHTDKLLGSFGGRGQFGYGKRWRIGGKYRVSFTDPFQLTKYLQFDIQFFCNRINAQLNTLGGNPGIQIEDSKGTMDDVRVFANTINQTWGPGIWLISYDSGSTNYQNITIDHNRILKGGVSYNIHYTAGITIDGVQGTNISNNVFDGCNNAGILVMDGGEDTKIEKNSFSVGFHNGVNFNL